MNLIQFNVCVYCGRKVRRVGLCGMCECCCKAKIFDCLMVDRCSLGKKLSKKMLNSLKRQELLIEGQGGER